MFLIQFSDIASFLFLSTYVFLSFLLPNFCLDFISSVFFFLSNFFVLNLLEKIILCNKSLLMKSVLSSLFVFHLGLFSRKILCKDSLVLQLLLSLVVFDDRFSHHIHKFSLSSFTIRHFVSSFLFLSFDKSNIFFLSFDVFQLLFFFFF